MIVFIETNFILLFHFVLVSPNLVIDKLAFQEEAGKQVKFFTVYELLLCVYMNKY